VGDILAGKSSAKVKQNALVALGSLATAHGKDSPAKLLATIPAVLTQVRLSQLLLLQNTGSG
jgi:hypothetical protein